MADGAKTSVTRGSLWARWAMPSAADLMFVGIACALVFTPLSVRLLDDAGIGWHIRAGQQMLAAHAVPRVDSFSSTMSGKPWFAWEWLFDVAVGWLDSAAGLNGVVWLAAVMIGLTFALTLRTLVRRGTNLPVAVGLVLLAVAASMIHFLARPHVVSWLLTVAWFCVLDSKHDRRAWALPALMVVWVNVHGGFLVGFVVLGIFFVGALCEWLQARGDRLEDIVQRIAAGRRSWRLLWVGMACAVASLVNPYGWKLHEHVYSYLTNRFLMDHINEFQSPNFHGVAERCFLVLVLIAVVVLAAKIPTQAAKGAACMGHPTRPRMTSVLIVLFAIYAGCYASRNIPIASLLMVLVVGPMMRLAGGERMHGSFASLRMTTRGFVERITAVELNQRGHIWAVVAAVVTLLIALNGGRAGSSVVMDAHFDAKRMPVGAVAFLEKSGITGPVLSVDSWGGYLIYRLHPKMQVVLDDRHDLYGEAFLRDYLKMLHVEPGWKQFLREHPAECAVLPSEAALTTVLRGDREWRAVYDDEVAVVFVGMDIP